MRKKYGKLMIVVLSMMSAVLSVGCGEFQTLLKVQDYEQWYVKGMQYYQQGEYDKAARLLGGILSKNVGNAR